MNKAFLKKRFIDGFTGIAKGKVPTLRLAKGRPLSNYKILGNTNGVGDRTSTTYNTPSYSMTIGDNILYADVKKVGGKSVVWNQLFNLVDITRTTQGVTMSFSSDGSVTLNGTAAANASQSGASSAVPMINGHKYFFTGYNGYENIGIAISDTKSYSMVQTDRIYACPADKLDTTLNIYIVSGSSFENVVIYPKCINLTKLYGAGNEPTTTSDSRITAIKEYLASHPEYNEGQIIDSLVDKVEVQGANILENADDLLRANGWVKQNGVYRGHLNHLHTASSNNPFFQGIYEENTQYTFSAHFKLQEAKSVWFIIKYTDGTYKNYSVNDADFDMISTSDVGKTVLGLWISYGTTTITEISNLQITKSSTQYPYKPYTKKSITTNFPVLRSAGSVYDEIDIENQQIIRRVGTVDLGTLTWQYFNEDVYPSLFKTNYFIDIMPIQGGLLNNKYTQTTVNSWIDIKSKTMVHMTNSVFAIKDDDYTNNLNGFKNSLQGQTLYYELAEPTTESITITPELLEWLEVEYGGTLTYHQNGTKMAIPNEVDLWSPTTVKMNVIKKGTDTSSVASSVTIPENVHYAELQKLGGSSLVWNQYCDNRVYNAATQISAIDDEITYIPTKQYGGIQYYYDNGATPLPVGHVILGYAKVKFAQSYSNSRPYLLINDGTNQTILSFNNTITEWQECFVLRTIASGAVRTFLKIQDPNATDWNQLTIKNHGMVDLTKLYGAGNEPTTTDDPRITAIKEYLTTHPEYNAGEILNADVESVEVQGVNLLDESKIKTFDKYITSQGSYKYTDKIYLEPNTEYRMICSHNSTELSGKYFVLWNGGIFENQYFRYPLNNGVSQSVSFTTTNDGYVRLGCNEVGGAENLNVIMSSCTFSINKGSTALPYTPYKHQSISTDLPTLRSAGSVKDEIDFSTVRPSATNGMVKVNVIRRVGSVDLGSLTWYYKSGQSDDRANGFYCITAPRDSRRYNDVRVGSVNQLCDIYKCEYDSLQFKIDDKALIYNNSFDSTHNMRIHDSSYTDADTFKTAMSGVMLYYELATPTVETIEIPKDLADWLVVESGGEITFKQTNTEKLLPVPNTINYSAGNTVNLTIKNPLYKSGTHTDYIDYNRQMVVRQSTTESCQLPAINGDDNVGIHVDTQIEPSDTIITYRSKTPIN